MGSTTFLLVFIAICLTTGLYTKYLLAWLKRKSILDRPNERSSHVIPVPRGGGIAVIIPVLLAVLLVPGSSIPISIGLIAGMLALISWIDDLRPISASVRLGIHIVCVAILLFWISPTLNGLPIAPPNFGIYALAIFSWVWFINLYNFMDGIDGITCVETISICVGLLVLNTIISMPPDIVFLSVTIAAAAVGFTLWNWHPAKIFLGDVGSIPLGFLLGWMLIRLVEEGYGVVALILPGYYLADTTITLIRRTMKKERIWQAHRSHFYQRATRSGLSHNEVSLRILALNVCLIFFSVTAVLGYPMASIGAAAFSILLFLFRLPTHCNNSSND